MDAREGPTRSPEVGLAQLSPCSAAIAEFSRLIGEARAADLREEPIEPHLVRLLTAIKRHPECRSEYATAFKDLVESRVSIPWELIPFCMHELRWAEVRTVIEERSAHARQQNDWRAIAVYSKYLDAFSEAWESADLFAYYGAT